jgi:hypothetical protein
MECKKSQNENEENSTSTNNSISKKINIYKKNILGSPSFNMNLDPRSLEYKIIANISNTLVDSCDSNSEKYCVVKNQKLISPFTTAKTTIKIQDYLERLYIYGRMNISTILLMLIYIDRLCNINKIKLSYKIIHKLMLSSLIVAIKYNEDEMYSLKFYAGFGGVSIEELEYLEICFISRINFNLFIKEDIYNKYYEYFADTDSEDKDIDEEDEKEEREERERREEVEEREEKEIKDLRKEKLELEEKNNIQKSK